MEFDISQLATLAPIVKDAVIAVAAMVTSGIAVYGVRVWKRDLVGKELYEVTKTLVYQSHSVAQACTKLLLPILASENRVFTAAEVEHTTVGERWRLSETHVYRTRLRAYTESLEEFSDALLKARVVMGSRVYGAFLPFQNALRQPVDEINNYLSYLQDPSSYLLHDSEEAAALQSFVYRSADDGGSKIVMMVADAREDAEKFLLPYLHRNSIFG